MAEIPTKVPTGAERTQAVGRPFISLRHEIDRYLRISTGISGDFHGAARRLMSSRSGGVN
jgi:hypothetical protein